MRPIPLVERVLRYGIAGVAVSLLYAVLVIALERGLPMLGPTCNAALAFLMVQPVGLLLHSVISYPETVRMRARLPKIGLRFVVTNAAGFAISTGGMALVTGPLSASYLWGIAVAWALIPALNFVIYLVWVFQPAHRPQERI
jgi:hypothetical protein